MTQASHYILTLDLAVQDPIAVLDAAAAHVTRTGMIASVEAARAYLADDVAKAITVLIGLRNLSSAGVMAVQIDCTLDPRPS